ncbi:hypothetical protein [Flavobacterium sp. J27]|uniref:hypothetical protein n=1 Tax=Flavobacterium sp. J27 TaxID=2060419 RepID=UPI001031AEC9|nr:hypothetical protein [Flavobacterium sp. J27]
MWKLNKEFLNILNPNANRKNIHFAKSYNNKLFIIQEDTVLSIWKIDPHFQITKEYDVNLGSKFYNPNFQFLDNKLLLNNRYGEICIIDFNDYNNLITIFSKDIEGRESCCMYKNKLYSQIYLTNTDGYSISDLPTIKNPNPKTTIAIQKENISSGSYALVTNTVIYWINQESIFIMDVSNPDIPKSIVEKEIVDLVMGYPILVANNRMVVIETYDANRIGCNFFDISNNNIKRLQKGQFKNHCIRAFHLSNDYLFLVHLDFKKINNERKYKTYLSAIDINNDFSIRFTKELPFIEIYGDDSSKIVWVGEYNNKIIILLANGKFFDLILST